MIHFSGCLRLFKFIAFQTTDKVCTLWRKWILLRVKWTASHFKCIIYSPQALSYWFFLYYFILQSETLHNCGPCWQSAWQRKDSNKTDPGIGQQMHYTSLETSVDINFRCTNSAFRKKGAQSWIHILPCWAYIPYSNAICMTWYVDRQDHL